MERSSVIKHADNLKVEGRMENRSSLNQTFILDKAEKAAVVKHQDNLRLEGSMNMKRQEATVMKGERFGIVRREDNLKMEGSFEGRVKEASSSRRMSSASTGSRRGETRDKSNICIGDDSSVASTSRVNASSKVESLASAQGASTSRSHQSAVQASSTSQQSAVHAASSSSKTQVQMTSTSQQAAKSSVQASSTVQESRSGVKSSSQSTRTNVSSAVAGALVQSKEVSSSITAVNTDKFASSLRESSSQAVGQQKEISVIEHHRKQSLQKQRNEYSGGGWGGGWGGGEGGRGGGVELVAHTGRTAAYGGRDYEYSSGLVGRRSEARTNAEASGRSSAAFSSQETGGRAAYQSFSSTSKQQQLISSSKQQQQIGSNSSSSRQQQQQQLLSSSSSRQQQQQHASSTSTTYLTTAQQSFRGQSQVKKLRIDFFNPQLLDLNFISNLFTIF